jgi:hypothetical protein
MMALSTALALQADANEGVRADRILTAGKLQETCAASDRTEVGRLQIAHCLGALTGIADTAVTLLAFFQRKQSICLLPSDNLESMRLAFLAHMEREPEDKDNAAATVMMVVLADSYGCDKERS